MTNNFPSDTVKKITEFLFIEEEINAIPKSELVILFGSEFIEGSIDAIELLINNNIITSESKIILSGATGSLNAGKESEARRMYKEAINRGIDSNLFIIEDKATNSYQNLEFSKEIISSLGGFDKFNNILFVGKSFMLRRTQMVASKLNYPTDKIHYYGLVDKEGRNIAANCWWEREESKVRVMEELERIGKYAAKGDLSIF